MPSLLVSRAPAFLVPSLPLLQPRRSSRLSYSTPVARISHPTYLYRPRPRTVYIANASTAEEELFIRRQAEKAKEKDQKVEEQFDFVSEQKDKKEDPSPNLTDSDVLPDLKVPPVPSPEVVHATSTPRVSRSEGKKQQKSGEDAAASNVEKKVRVGVPKGMGRLTKRFGGEFSRLISESPVRPHVRIPTGRETITAVWEFAIIFAILALLRAGVASTLRWIHNRLNATRGLQSNIPYEASVFECMQRPLEFLSLFTVGTALGEAVSRPLAATGLLRHIMTLRELGIIFSAAWFLLRWIDRIRSRFAVDKRIDKAQVDATSRIATVATFVVSLLISLDTVGINVQTVLAFGGIGGVAIGFAGREIISNFFGGFMIYVTRPFTVGEWIRSIEEAELNGTVEDIGWYLTRVRTWDKRPLYIPNSRFSTLIVENGSRMANRRILHTIHLRHEDIPVIQHIVADIEKLLMTNPDLDPRQHRLAYVDSFDEFSVKLWLSCYTKSVFLYDYRRVQQNVLIACYDIIRARGAKLATRNTRDVRPGVDTDRYGPYGSAATFGEAIPRVPLSEPMAAPAPNSDVPGAPLYGIPQPAETLHTIESGVDLSKFKQSVVPSNAPVTSSADEAVVPMSSAESETSRKQRPLSNAAVAATAAAYLAARRNAKRKEVGQSSTVDESVPIPNEKVEAQAATTEVKSKTGLPSGEMKISAAPPRNGPASGTVNDFGSLGGEGKVSEEVLSTSNAGQHSSTKIGRSATEDPSKGTRSVSENSMTTSPPAGEMKITKARKPRTVSPKPGATDEVGQPPSLETPSSVSKRSNMDVTEKPPQEKRLSEDIPAVKQAKQFSTSVEDTGNAGLMKITAARPSKPSNVVTEKKREENEGERLIADDVSETNRLGGSAGKEAKGSSESKMSTQKVTSNTSSSGGMKIKGTRPVRKESPSANKDGTASTNENAERRNPSASLVATSNQLGPHKPVSSGSVPIASQPKSFTDDYIPPRPKNYSQPLSSEPVIMSETSAEHTGQTDSPKSQRNMPFPTSEEHGTIES